MTLRFGMVARRAVGWSQKFGLSGRIEGMKQVLGMAKTGLALGVAMAAGMVSAAGAQSEVHGRNWKPLPPTAHIEVTVVKGFNGKPLPNAAVVFHAVRDGKNDGNLEVKTNPEGKAIIDVIEVGSHVTVQVIAGGFADEVAGGEADPAAGADFGVSG